MTRYGKPFCHQHDPVEEERRRDANYAKFREKTDRRISQMDAMRDKAEKYDALKLRSDLLQNHVRELCTAMRQLGKEHHREVVAVEITLKEI